MLRIITLSVLVLLGTVGGSVELRSFDTPEHEQRFKSLVAELRCLVCQNQSLSDSDADLAQDLRREVHEMLSAGRSDREILDFMVARYGDFVLYRPPFKAYTAALWIGPFVLGIGALGGLLWHLYRRQQAPADTGAGGAEDPAAGLAPGERERLATLLARRDGGES